MQQPRDWSWLYLALGSGVFLAVIWLAFFAVAGQINTSLITLGWAFFILFVFFLILGIIRTFF